MIRINLLSEGKRPTAVRRTRTAPLGERDWTNPALVAGIVLMLLVGGVYWFVLNRRAEAVQAEVAAAQEEVDKLASVLAEVEEFKAKKADLDNKIQVITQLKNNQTGPVRLMDAVSRALPELLWLDNMRVTGSTIQMTGRAFNYSAISYFIENLGKVPEFREPQLEQAAENGPVYRFTINVDYSLTPPRAEAEDGGPAVAAAGG